MQTAITLGAEFHRRLVAQRTVRPDSVVLAPPPSCFAAGIGHRFEFLAIQELVTQSAMKRLDEAILPRTRRRHRDCFRSRLWKPTGQDLTDELRAVVAADPRRRSAATYHARQHPAHVRPGHRRADVERQALPSIFVHQREPLERTSVGGAIDDEIARPHVVLETRRLVHATVGAATRHAGFPGFLAARRSPETEFVPQPPHAFAIHAPALMPQSRVNALVAIARMPPGQSPDRLDQSIFAGTLPATITDGRTRSAQDPAGAPLRDAIGLAQIVRGRSLLRGGHHFFLATSWSICLSSISSAQRRLSRSTSVSSSRTRRASSTWAGSNRSRQR